MASARSVLVVDDDAIVLRILGDQIAREGYVIDSAASNAEAIQHLNQTPFGIVIADQTMPELSGIDFLRKCRAIQPLASRVLVTGSFGLSEIDRALRDGEICRLLIKPWTRFDLVSLLQQAYERYELLCEREQLQREIALLQNQVGDLTRRLRFQPVKPPESIGHRAESELQSTNQMVGDGERRDQQQQLVHQARLEALGQMASGVAHEFNNALIPILGYIELMLEKDQLLDDREKARDYLRLALTAAKEATRVANRLREFYGQSEKSEAASAVEPDQAVANSFVQAIVPGAETSRRKMSKALKVLIVDDDKTSREVLSLFLENDHHEVSAASSGPEALQFLRQGRYDLLVTDQGMPGMPGTVLIDAVREQGNTLPIIMVTGFGELMRSSGAVPEGVELVVNKPITMEALRSALLRIFPNDAVNSP
jgi:CheY-like chemotaxis protein